MPKLSPAIIFSEPQLGENIGAAARAMANFGLSDLRLVRPRDGWPNEKAEAMAVGATGILTQASVHGSVREAIGDLKLVYAATARDRAMSKPVLTPAEAAERLREAASAGVETGLLFGNERAGLTNDEVALSDAIVTIPTDAQQSSINLGQAVVILSYEWFKSGDCTPPEHIDRGAAQLASREELFLLFEHLEQELEKSGFLYPPGNRASMIRNLRSILHRASLSDQEVRTFRGAIKALTRGRRRRGRDGPRNPP